MKLEYLCEMQLEYKPLPEFNDSFLLARPYGGEEGLGYGEGQGTVSGDKLQGIVRWVNHPRRRSDKAMLPDAHGVIKTDDLAIVMFSLNGRTSFEGDKGKQLLFVLFETDAAKYNWLNTAICVLEGVIDSKSLRMNAKVYRCLNEMQ